eukprot:8781628-Pyramimonas_sp.AAC.1
MEKRPVCDRLMYGLPPAGPGEDPGLRQQILLDPPPPPRAYPGQSCLSWFTSPKDWPPDGGPT